MLFVRTLDVERKDEDEEKTNDRGVHLDSPKTCPACPVVPSSL